jgi:hypothetical protein
MQFNFLTALCVELFPINTVPFQSPAENPFQDLFRRCHQGETARTDKGFFNIHTA